MKKKSLGRLILSCLIISFVVAHQCNSQERELIIVIPSYNNKSWYQRNLDSVFEQDYSNYTVIYIDDVSSDGTGDLVAEYGQKYIENGKLILVKNTVRKLALANLYETINALPDNVIVVILDGDDWFADKSVLSYINDVYTHNDIWLTYGQYETHPQKQKGGCREIPTSVIASNSYRDYQYVASHLKTFYAGLFKKIKKEDLWYQGDFFTMDYDIAIMFPMLEMAGGHSAFISKVLYIYNTSNPIADWRKNARLQTEIANIIRARPRYQPLSYSFNRS